MDINNIHMDVLFRKKRLEIPLIGILCLLKHTIGEPSVYFLTKLTKTIKINYIK